MASIPVGHTSLQEAYGQFLAKYDADGVRFTEEPILKAEHEVADRPFSQHLVPYKRHVTYRNWENLTHSVQDQAIKEFKFAFENGELIAFHEKDGRNTLYKIEPRTWRNCFNMERAFYSDAFGLFNSDLDANPELEGITAFVEDSAFDKWLRSRLSLDANIVAESQLGARDSEPSTAFADACRTVANGKKQQHRIGVKALRRLADIFYDREPEQRYSSEQLLSTLEDNGINIAWSTLNKLLIQVYKIVDETGPNRTKD